jgi:hypothetical protein
MLARCSLWGPCLVQSCQVPGTFQQYVHEGLPTENIMMRASMTLLHEGEGEGKGKGRGEGEGEFEQLSHSIVVSHLLALMCSRLLAAKIKKKPHGIIFPP